LVADFTFQRAVSLWVFGVRVHTSERSFPLF
jgi:hypothetical protein